MSDTVHSFDRPSESLADQAAARAFDAIDAFMAEQGIKAEGVYALVMITIPDGQPRNSTVAASLPGERNPTTERLLEYALPMLNHVAGEVGVTITARQDRQN